jgi:hypothetical protein
VAFPPNYRQERSNRERTKQRKAQEKLAKREEKSMTRKHEPDEGQSEAPAAEQKDE